VGGIICFFLFSLKVSEPVFQGKTASYWVDHIDTSDEAEKALRQIGTNAIPMLLAKLQAKDSKFKTWLIALADKQDFMEINFKTAEDEYRLAVKGFGILGENATSAVPALIEMYDRNPTVNERIAMVVGNIGPSAKAAIPSLMRRAASTNNDVRDSAVFALGQIHSAPESVVPMLIKALGDPFQQVRSDAVRGLAAFGTNSKAAIPILLDLASDSHPVIRSEVMDALRLTQGDSRVVVPVLKRALGDSNDFVRARAAYALGAFGTNSIPAIPSLLALAADTNFRVRDLTVCALGEIQSEPQIVVPVLIKALNDRDSRWIRANAAEGLGNFGTNATEAIPALIELYFNEKKRFGADEPDIVGKIRESIKKISPEAATKAGVQ
jgi:HEAT repeat protein